jgi:hypothetical protein
MLAELGLDQPLLAAQLRAPTLVLVGEEDQIVPQPKPR